MSQQDYETMQPVLAALEVAAVKPPNMPIDAFVQEAENLYHWSQQDREDLEHAGFDWSTVAELPVRAGACREAESRWITQRFTREDARKQWAVESVYAYDLRDELLHTLTYAYRNQADLLGRVQEIRDGNGHADMVQDLNDLAVLGRANLEPLAAINFTLTRLDEAATLAKSMGNLYGQVNSEQYVEVLDMRNRAYTALYYSVRALRDCGQYVFWRDEERVQGYRSAYVRKLNRKVAKKEEISPI